MMHATVVGAGLAGCEAAMQLAREGIAVTLVEMKPGKRSVAHHCDWFAELVCSNSLKAQRTDSAAGLLKQEMRRFSSVCMQAALSSQVPAGGALAVDRDLFAQKVTQQVKNHPLIAVEQRECLDIPQGVCVIATGPLTDGALAHKIKQRLGSETLSFYDAAAPIVTADSIDPAYSFSASRYEKEGGDYLNCPLNKEEYEGFYQALVTAERAVVHSFDQPQTVYEGCMPIEVMAARGPDTIRFGPMKPVGLRDPRTGHRPWAVLQLRKENAQGSLLNLVGFQTNLKFSEQKRVFSMIPALHDAEFVRYGVMHRNSFLDSPRLLGPDYCARHFPGLYFAGQLTGVEGYMESASSGILAGQNAARYLQGKPALILPEFTMMGALAHYISDPTVTHFQPIGANFGVLPSLSVAVRDKRARYAALSQRSIDWMDAQEWAQNRQA